ncbi:MAG: leucine--tRNA ligase [Tannerella sp.]|jgi:leucyl-tRNA synthetase|nr:leucine--tRNA ligase [Tannerella sp.]
MEYAFRDIEKKWQEYWKNNHVYRVSEDAGKPKYYVLDMFPYPSGAGLHVGHPLGYIASDIYSRYKRLSGYNVLHPMGYDAYGLPAEQYAIQTGQHPAITTENNINRYREQMDKIGFSYDWSREVRTCDSKYYKWTQWAFIQMFNSYYCYGKQQARPIDGLIRIFETQGTEGLNIACTEELEFSASEWKAKSDREKQEILMNYRIAYLADSMVNWCPALGTVLANDEVSEGISIRGGHPVEQKLMRQWSLRISAYAQRLLNGLETIDWTDSLKETQRNWIGRSEGAEIRFHLTPDPSPKERGKEGYKYMTTNKLDWNANIDNARRMRKAQTDAENILWNNLKNRSINGLKFRRQHLIDQFIVDFVCLEKKIVIEIDGEYHNSPEQQEYDKNRSQYLNDNGFQVIRFTNNEIFFDLENVIKKITSTALSPLSRRGAGGEVLIFTTRPDTIFGVTFMVLAPESDLVQQLTTPAQSSAVHDYLLQTKKRTERERIADRKITGVFSGSYAVNPVSGATIPIWIADYVLAGYGTGAIMAVPGHDSRDYAFARHFDLPIIPLIEGADISEESYDAKDGIMMNSGFLNGLTVKEAIKKANEYIADNGLGRIKVNYRLRDAIFSRQRYWGEPFPIYYDKDAMPQPIPEDRLPLELPAVDRFLPTETGAPPLGNASKWAWDTANNQVVDTSSIDNQTIFPLELCTMPGFAGSSAYYLHYMDPNSVDALVSPKACAYWRNVDLYIGGTEHATGHLIYSRFWNKFLYDTGISCEEEPFKKLINQGMIQGRSNFVYRVQNTNTFVSLNLKEQYEVTPLHVDVNLVSNDVLDINAFKRWNPEYATAEFILEDGKYICGWAVEKMSKSMYNVVNPDMIVEKYGADTLRLYEMFLGPLEQSKPWDTNGIDGVHRFLKRLWALFYGNSDTLQVTDDEPTAAELKSLHKLIKKITYDIEHFSFNTSVSAFMICINELGSLKCSKRAVLQPLAILLSPFAPHLAEELWHLLGCNTTVCDAKWPEWNEEFLHEDMVTYVISFNGKARFNIDLPADISAEDAEKAALANPHSAKWLSDKTPKKVIVVPGKIVNIVV